MTTRTNWLSAAVLTMALYVVPASAQSQQCVNTDSTEAVAITAVTHAVNAAQAAATTTANALSTLNLFTLLAATQQNTSALLAVTQAEAALALMAPSALMTDLRAPLATVTSGISSLRDATNSLLAGNPGAAQQAFTTALGQVDSAVGLARSLPPLCRE
ncbi:hypothetical protein COCOR_00790 [Corallococcus coralloides DSM 2259]|uniref:Uncharacterized protein n=1 Tax=Corallococcus coralloides (strain ATCC 25202 / DSM 2259 / NBRC 100086 / M2) TaxID=1144275 RepID=H8MIQ5_CORCM|nr:hypothetical protein [Corallococcus coralloides]AFE03706.1 hypothetical protein COCOR_00790 [Corallococcus coralloides DSM 2259]